MGPSNFKLIKTKPGIEAKIGDTVIRIVNSSPRCPLGATFTTTKERSINTRHYYTFGKSLPKEDTLMLCKANGNVTSPKEEPKTIVIPTPKGASMEANVFDPKAMGTGSVYSGALLGQSKFNQTTKEDTMSKDIEIKINGEVVCTGAKTAKKKTGLEIQKKSHKVYAVYFNEAGNAVEEGFYKSEADATQRLASPALVGCTVVTYKQSKAIRQKLQLEEA